MWDETLYAGSAAYYPHGRMPYPPELAAALRDELSLDGEGRLLDVGCGPGSLTVLLAPLFERAVGVDADAEMLAEATRQAASRGVENADWVHMRAEELPGGLGSFRVATFAQSFHWMDQDRVATAVETMLEPGRRVGARARNDASRLGDDAGLPRPAPPHEGIDELVQRYLGPVRRAGRGTLPHGTPSGEEDVMLAAGFAAPRRLQAEEAACSSGSEDEVVASVFSRSGSAPHLSATAATSSNVSCARCSGSPSPSGRFSERTREIELVIWRR